MNWIKFEDKPPTITLQATKILCNCPKWITPIVAYYTHFEDLPLASCLSIPKDDGYFHEWEFDRVPTHYAIIDKPPLQKNSTVEQRIGKRLDPNRKRRYED